MSLRHILLAALSKRPDTGYGLNRLLRDDLNHIWHARQQQIYRELGKLESDGLVRAECVPQDNRPDKKVYWITQAGADQLDAWLTGSIPPPEAKTESWAKLYCIEQLPKGAMERLLSSRLEQWGRLCGELRTRLERAEAAAPGDLGYRLTLTAALGDAEAKMASCALLLTMLRDTGDIDGLPSRRDGARPDVAAVAGGSD
jgi:DNA-binding PadR family transcriptional regulator